MAHDRLNAMCRSALVLGQQCAMCMKALGVSAHCKENLTFVLWMAGSQIKPKSASQNCRRIMTCKF